MSPAGDRAQCKDPGLVTAHALSSGRVCPGGGGSPGVAEVLNDFSRAKNSALLKTFFT